MHYPVIEIHMLGSFTVTRDGQRLESSDYGSRKGRELLRWLVDTRNQVITDDTLVHALWPDVPVERALRSLRVRVSELRRLLRCEEHGDLLERIDDGYRLRTVPNCLEVDVDRFTTLAEHAMEPLPARDAQPLLEQCLSLYQGEYMADDPYTQRWESTRERCRSLYLAVANKLAAVYEELGQFDAAIGMMQELLKRPDRDEGHYRTLMRLQYLNGDQAGALRTYQECRLYLDEELGVRPIPETMRLLEKILRHEPLSKGPQSAAASPQDERAGPKSSRTAEWPFLGRKKEMTQIASHIHDLNAGKGGVVWIHGPSGIGKSRLLHEAIKARSDEGTHRIMWIRGSQLNARIPFVAIVDGIQTGVRPQLSAREKEALMEPALPNLQQLLGWRQQGEGRPPSGGAKMQEDVWLRQELLECFERLVRNKPLICCIDDGHSLGAASQSLILALARRVQEWPILLLITSRRRPEDAQLASELLRSVPDATIVELKPLSLAALRPLVGHGVPALWSQRWLRQVHHDTGGEPLSLVEMLNFLQSQAMIDRVDGEVVFNSGLLTLMTERTEAAAHVGTVYGADEYERRLATLDASERTLLYKSAVLGNSLTIDRLRGMVDDSASAFMQQLERLIREGFLTMDASDGEGEPRLAFTHSRLQRLTYQGIPSSERTWYHHRAFSLLQAEMANATGQLPTVELSRLFSAGAWHALVAGEWEEGTELSLKAADAARRIATGPESVSLCRQAYQASQRLRADHPLREKATQACADALFSVGAYKEALPLIEKAAVAYDVVPPEVNRQLIETYLQLNRTDEALNRAGRFLAEAKKKGDESLGRALVTNAYVHYRRGEIEAAIEAGEEAITRFRRGGNEEANAEAYSRTALLYWDLGRYDKAVEYTKQSVELRRQNASPNLTYSLNVLGELYQDLFCTERAIATHREALGLAIRRRELVMSTEIWRNLGLDFVYEGRTEKGLTTLHQAWQQAQDLALGPYRKEKHLRALLEVKILMHDVGKAKELLTKYKQVIGPREVPFVAIFAGALALLEERIDEGEAMLAEVQAFWDQTGRRGRAFHVLMFAGQALLMHGKTERAKKYLRLAVQEMERLQRQLPAGLVEEMGRSRQFVSARKLIEIT